MERRFDGASSNYSYKQRCFIRVTSLTHLMSEGSIYLGLFVRMVERLSTKRLMGQGSRIL